MPWILDFWLTPAHASMCQDNPHVLSLYAVLPGNPQELDLGAPCHQSHPKEDPLCTT